MFIQHTDKKKKGKKWYLCLPIQKWNYKYKRHKIFILYNGRRHKSMEKNKLN